MTIFLVTLAVFALAMVAMGIGALLGGRRLRGSCGGLAVDCNGERRESCEFCGTSSSDEEVAS